MDIESLATVLIMQDQDHPLLDDDDVLMMRAADIPANRQPAQPWPRCGKTWHALAQPGQLWASAGSEPASQSWLRPGVNCHCQLWPKTGPRLATGRLGDPLSGTGTELAQTWLNSLSF